MKGRGIQVKELHSVEIKDGRLWLDEKPVNGVTGFNLKSSADSEIAELEIKLIVNLGKSVSNSQIVEIKQSITDEINRYFQRKTL